MKSVGRWALLVMTVVSCVALGYAAYTLAQTSWNAVVDYRSPYTRIELPPAKAAPRTAQRTVLVIVDGLRLDASLDMGTLNLLRSYGMDLELTAPQPTLSYPNWTTLLSGAPPYVSGVVTNWHEGQAQVETLFDSASRSGAKTVFVGPEDFDQLYGVKTTANATFMKKWDKEYLSGQYVDAALRLAEQEKPRLLVLHLPDADEAGHDFGGASPEYKVALAKIDADLRRLVEGLQDEQTLFVIVSDHGHIDTGGHGGWEDDVVKVPGVFAGPGVLLGTGTGKSEDVAPTVAALSGIPVPRSAQGSPLELVLRDGEEARTAAAESRARFDEAYRAIVTTPKDPTAQAKISARLTATGGADDNAKAEAARLSVDREGRLPLALIGVAAAFLVLALVGFSSSQALGAALAGTAAYYTVYNLLFFVAHRYRWSLSAFNSEDKIDAWMNLRLVEAAISAILAVVVAGIVYPFLRRRPKGAWGQYLPGWLTLGPVTVLVILATLGLQIAWFIWAWGVVPEWRLPDLKWGFKYDLDLIQATAIGFVAVLTPLVTFLVGRYHPKVEKRKRQGEAPHGHQGPA